MPAAAFGSSVETVTSADPPAITNSAIPAVFVTADVDVTPVPKNPAPVLVA